MNNVATYDIVNEDVINLATDFLNFLKFDQSVFQFDFRALRKSISRFLILCFVSLIIHGRLCLDLVVLQGTQLFRRLFGMYLVVHQCVLMSFL